MRSSRFTVGVVAAVSAGVFLVASGLLTSFVFTVWAAGKKIQGGAPGCDWSMIAGMYSHLETFADLVDRSRNDSRIVERDTAAGLDLIEVGDLRFWAPAEASEDGARVLVSYLVAEHDFAAAAGKQLTVRPGDIVIDCGAHVGVFTKKALQLGAERVVAVDPGPLQGECLRRNLKEEIADGRVVVVPAGVWSESGVMTMYLSGNNSGMGSLLEHDEEHGHTSIGEVEAPVTTIDLLVAELKLPRVDFIKMDIEGAEREALAGAQTTLKRFHPRLMIDSYHRPDDMVAIPAALRSAREDYRGGPSGCEPQADGNFAPHFAFYH
jgi:FkbM family methyltransferase